MVFDMPDLNRASSVAAGLFNPITGKRIVKTWKADEMFSYLIDFYRSVEKEYHIQFFNTSPLYTPFKTIEEQNEWMGKSADESFRDYILQVTSRSTYGDEVNDPLGGILLGRCGYIKTNIFLEGIRNVLKRDENYREEKWENSKMSVSDEGVVYNDLIAEKIIFCTGIHLLENQLFKGLPLKPLKGEVMSIKLPMELNRIYNRGVYIVESGDNIYKVGATYDLSNLQEETTVAGRKELEEKTKELLSMPFEVTHQDWGIRPSTIDRRPLIGAHPDQKNILVFNGLGTKGVSLAPYFSDQLADHIIGSGNLDKEANINRVKSLYSRFR